MEESNYPNLPNHRKSHEAFVKSVTRISEEFGQTGPTADIVKSIIKNVGSWLVNHIQREDALIAAYLKKRQAAASV